MQMNEQRFRPIPIVPFGSFLIGSLLAGMLTFGTLHAQAASVSLSETPDVVQQTAKGVVHGFIGDENGEAITGAVVKYSDGSAAAVTAADGTFSLKAPADPNATLEISYIGYQSRDIKLKGRQFVSISLIPDNKTLDEVVVVGFGKQKKESLVGAVQAVKPEDLRITSSSLTTSFAGNIPGIIARQTSGEPGYDNASFYIRGVSTFGSSTAPLILLDGVEINATMLNNIPPESIESFSVLKDATATSLYGSRGANGVILVNTKLGNLSEKMKVNIRFDNTVSMPTRVQDIADGVTYMQMFNEASYNDAQAAGTTYTAPFSDDKIEKTRTHANPYIFPDNDWYSMLFKDYTMNQNLDINMRGGSKFLTYYLNAGIYYENGIVKKPTDLSALDVSLRTRKYFFQSNVTANLTRTTKVGLNMNTQLFYYHGPKESISNLFYYTMRVNPVAFPAVLPSEPGDTYTRYGNSTKQGVGGIQTNPLARLSTGYTERNYVYSTTAFNVEQDLSMITPGLKASGLASFYNYSFNWLDHWTVPFYYRILDDYTVDENGQYQFNTESIGDAGEPYLKSNSGRDPTTSVWSLQAKIDYAHKFGKHDVGATFVYHMKETKQVKDGGDEYDLLPYREQGLAGRATYNYDMRYFLELTFGYNGSENFRKGHRFGFFPAVAAGWTLSHEKFFKPLKPYINNLKIRGSYGVVGNDALSARFPYVTTVDMSTGGAWWFGDAYSNPSVPSITNYGNVDASWEKSYKTNIGVDLSLFHHLDFTLDFFHEKRDGIFMQRQSILSVAGFGGKLPWANIGAVKNRGFDMSANYTQVFNKDFTVRVNGTFTYAHNEITACDEPTNVADYYSRIGHPINSIRGLVAEGLFTSQEEIDNSPKQELGSSYTVGNIKYKDLNGDNKIDLNDVTTIGNPTIPEIIYGFGTTVTFKKWDFSCFFQGAAKVSLLMSGIQPFVDNTSDGYGIAQFIVDDHWSETNNRADAAYPRLSASYVNNDSQASSFYLRSGNYLRLKTAEVGYTFNKWIRAYVSGSNLLTFSPFKHWDPELGGGTGLKYPLQRTVKVGIQFHY